MIGIEERVCFCDGVKISLVTMHCVEDCVH
jgi:hypothetical protein